MVRSIQCKKRCIDMLAMSESWPFSCPVPTVLLSRSFSFQSAFSNFSMVGITVNRTQQVLSRSAQGCTRWHEKYILSNKICLTPNFFLSLSSAFLMALIKEDIWGAEGQRLFARLGEVFEWINIWTENNPRSAGGENLWKFLMWGVHAGERLEGREILESSSLSLYMWGIERNQTKNKQTKKAAKFPPEPIQDPKQQPRFAPQTVTSKHRFSAECIV